MSLSLTHLTEGTPLVLLLLCIVCLEQKKWCNAKQRIALPLSLALLSLPYPGLEVIFFNPYGPCHTLGIILDGAHAA